MTRIRLVLFAGLALLAVSALASTSASAAECPDTVKGSDVALCIEGKEAADGTYPFTSVKKAGTGSELNVQGGPRIVCEKAKNTGEFEVKDGGNPQLEVSDVVIEFSGNCKVTTNEKQCEVIEPIIANGGGDGIDGTISKTNEVTLKPSQGASFATIKTKSKIGQFCPIFEETNVEGEQVAKLPGSTTEATKHEIVAEASGSKLTAFGLPATFVLTEEMELTSKKLFSLQES
jgi:carbon monoxide dehydrogenase subunit G